MMKKTMLILCFATAVVLSAGTVMAETNVSRDKINALSEASGIDAEQIYQILDEADIMADQLEGLGDDEIIEGLRMKVGQSQTRDYGYLFSDPSIRQTLDDGTLLRVAVFSSDDAINPSLLIDYSEKQIYYSGGIRFFDNLDYAESVIPLDDATAVAVREIVREILEIGYNSSDNAAVLLGSSLAGLAIETSVGVTSYVIENVQSDSEIELSNYISRIFRIYYDKNGY